MAASPGDTPRPRRIVAGVGGDGPDEETGRRIQSFVPDLSDPFGVLGLERRFDLTRAQIDSAYLARMALAHPDVAHGDESHDLAATLNSAKRDLLDPERRAGALLSLLGGPGKDEDKSLPAGFLAKMMSTREEIEESLTGDPATRVRWQAWARSERGMYDARVGGLFAATSPNLALIRRELNAWRYIERLIEQLEIGYEPNTADFGGE